MSLIWGSDVLVLVRLNMSALVSNLDLYPWVFHTLKVLPRSSWVWTHEYHILMGYLTSTCRCKETYEYSQVFGRELIEIIQLSINITIFEYLRWLKSLIFIFRSWQVTNIDSNLYICHRYLHKYLWHISKSILGSLKTHRHGYLRLMSVILVSIHQSTSILLRAFDHDFYNFISFKGIDVKEVRLRIRSELELCQIGLGAQPVESQGL